MTQGSVGIPVQRGGEEYAYRGVGWFRVARPAQRVAVEASGGSVSSESLRVLQTAIRAALSSSQDVGTRILPSTTVDAFRTMTGYDVPAAPVPAGDDRDPTVAVNGCDLTAREYQVLQGAAEGSSNARIAQQLSVSEHTVKTHLRRLYAKIGATDRAHAVTIGFRAGVLS